MADEGCAVTCPTFEYENYVFFRVRVNIAIKLFTPLDDDAILFRNVGIREKLFRKKNLCKNNAHLLLKPRLIF